MHLAGSGSSGTDDRGSRSPHRSRAALQCTLAALLWLLIGIGATAGASGVAVLINTDFVNYAPNSSGSEASNVVASLIATGYDVTPFSDLSAASIAQVTEINRALVVPELEVAAATSLFDSLGPAAVSEIRAFVQGGGVLVTMADAGGDGIALVNALFGWRTSESATTSSTYSQTDGVHAAAFRTAPLSLAAVNRTLAVSVASLPPGGTAIYANGDAAAVTALPFGKGHVVQIGWDWFNAAPTGSSDAGWLAVLASAVALPPGNRSAALFANTTFVAYDPTSSSAEASNMEASLLSGGTRVTRFTGTDGVSVAAALAGHQALVIPDLSASPSGGLSSALGSPSRTTINDFVNDGGLLLTVLDSGGHAIDLLNQTFGFSITPATATSTSYNRDAAAAAGTGLTAAPATLPANNATRSVTVASLPALARPLYVNGDRTTTVAWMVPVGRGWVVQLGWDWFNATPVGTLDAGWNTVMRQLVVSRTMERDVALLVDNTFVEYVPGSAGAEASNMEQSLLNLGWNVDGFTGTAAATLATVLDSAAALVLPDLERAPATSFLDSLDSAARDVLSDYVNDGGVLVTCADGGQRAEQLLNTLFGFSLVRGIAASDYDLDAPAAVGTPFAGLSTSLASPNATRPVTVASLPPLARAVYRSNVDPMTDTAAVWFAPVGNGWVVHFGWDFFSAAPTGELDGGGIAALGAAVSLGRAEPPVTLLTSTLYVDYNPGATSAEASNLEALLQNHGHPVRRIDFIQASDFTAVLPGSAALVIPDLEKAALPSLVDSLDTQTRALLSDYVHGGGRLIVFGDAGDRAINLVNALFGYSLARGSVNPATYPLNGEVANGTPFASLPPSIPLLNASRTLLASSLPPQARAIYRSVADPVSDTAGVSAIPVGNGWVVFIAWDAFNAAPIGAIVDQTDAIVAGLSLTALITGAIDSDGDGVADEIDNCATLFAPDQTDTDGDTFGDACDEDDDGDGMPDDWELAYLLDPKTADGGGDADTDGFSNLDEFLAGTNPRNAASYPGKVHVMPWIDLLLLGE